MTDELSKGIIADDTDEIPFYPKKDGKLTAGRWHFLNTLVSLDDIDHDEAIENFGRTWGIPRWRIEAELAAYRLDCPERLQ
jgi:hypothetical protein